MFKFDKDRFVFMLRFSGQFNEMYKRKASDRENVNYPLLYSYNMDQFRKSELLCDGIVQCTDKPVNIHRVILSAVSQYFKVVFANTLHPGDTEKFHTSVDISSRYLNYILDYAYTGSCPINDDNVLELLIGADKYCVLDVVNLCSQYLVDNLTLKNCIFNWCFAKNYYCKNLENAAKYYICYNIEEIFRQSPEEVIQLNWTEIVEFLNDDELNVRNEKIVLKIIKAWTEYDESGRGKFVSQLVKCIRFYNKGKNHSLLKKLKQWKMYHDCESIKDIVQQLPSDAVQQLPRVPNDVVFAIGGCYSGLSTNLVETYDIRADRWYMMDNQNSFPPRSDHGVCTLDQLIYVIGGFDGNAYFNSVKCFDPVTSQWEWKSCMYQARCFVSVVASGGKIYALGGFDGLSRLSSAERYCPIKNQWDRIAPMNERRSHAGATSAGDKIYIIGGNNERHIVTSAEMYDTITNQWTYIKSIPGPRSGLSVVMHKEVLYCLGGFNGYIRLRNCIKLNLHNESEEWRRIPSMKTGRSNFASVIVDNTILVIGGFDGAGTVKTVESYDFYEEQWINICSMNIRRAALSACVVSGLPNKREFAYKHNLVHLAP